MVDFEDMNSHATTKIYEDLLIASCLMLASNKKLNFKAEVSKYLSAVSLANFNLSTKMNKGSAAKKQVPLQELLKKEKEK